MHFKTLFITFCLLGMWSCMPEDVSLQTPETANNAAISPAQDVSTTKTQSAAWSGSIGKYQNDIWLFLFKNGQATYDFRLGAGGAIAEMRDRTAGFKHFLAPSFNGEVTDRVVQWTIWSFNGHIKNAGATGLPDFEKRYNVTQGGTFTNQIHEVISVAVNQSINRVDVYSKSGLQWKSANQNALKGIHTALTRYTLDDRGFLKVRRIVLVAQPSQNGVPKNWTDLYLEGWTPMKAGQNDFNGLALGLNNNGDPTHWYLHNYNIPTYPQWEANTLNGYAVAG